MLPARDNIPLDRLPVVTLALIVANVVVYVLRGGSPPHELTVGTAFGGMFVQTSVLQLIGNMWFLWLFGPNVEDSMGPVRFLAFYIVGGLVALGLVLAIDPGASMPPAGAAGAIATVLGGYVVLYRRARVLALNMLIFFSGVTEIPVLVLLVLWVAMQAAFAAAGFIGDGGFAYASYAGGFLFGIATIRLVATRRKPTPQTASAYR